MHRKDFITTSGGAAAALATLAASAAAEAYPDQSQVASDQDVRLVRGRVMGIIGQLEYERTDYGGNRVRAIDALNAAKGELDAALSIRRSVTPGQGSSDAVLRDARGEIDRLLSRLNDDRADYGGHREKAIDDLQQARSLIDAALAVH